MKTLLIAALLLVSAGMAKADSVWTYSGNSQNLYSMNPFLPPGPNPCGCALTGTVTLADAFTPISWNFTAGNQSFTNANSSLSAYLGFAESRPTDFWDFGFQGADNSYLKSVFWGSINDTYDKSGELFVGSHPGTWTEVVATPEPGSLLLLGAGLALAVLGRRGLKRLAFTQQRSR